MIIVVSIRNQQQEEGKEPKVKLDDLDKFLRFFLLAVEFFCVLLSPSTTQHGWKIASVIHYVC
jgi:hypothetical protein